jgi:DNA mismatch repair protein MutL
VPEDELVEAGARTAARSVYLPIARELLPVSYTRQTLAVEGYVSRPTFTRPTRSGQHLFVNGRWIRNRTLTHALDEAYRSSMPGGRFPFSVLHVEIDPALVARSSHLSRLRSRSRPAASRR